MVIWARSGALKAMETVQSRLRIKENFPLEENERSSSRSKMLYMPADSCFITIQVKGGRKSGGRGKPWSPFPHCLRDFSLPSVHCLGCPLGLKTGVRPLSTAGRLGDGGTEVPNDTVVYGPLIPSNNQQLIKINKRSTRLRTDGSLSGVMFYNLQSTKELLQRGLQIHP